MKKLISVQSFILLAMFCFSACVMDSFPSIAVLKNNSHNQILVAKQLDEFMTDSTLYKESFQSTWITVDNYRKITVPNRNLASQPDSVKVYLYVFNADSVDKYQALKKSKGILKSSLIRKIVIQLNKVKEPLDTIYIR